MLNAPGDVDVDDLGVNSDGLKAVVIAADGDDPSMPAAMPFGDWSCCSPLPNVMPFTRSPRPRMSEMFRVSSASEFRSTVRTV